MSMNRTPRNVLTLGLLAACFLVAFAGWTNAAGKKAKYVKITPSYVVDGIPDGSSKQFTAVAEDENGIKLDPQPAIVWTVSSPSMTIDSSGLLTVKKGCNGCGGEIRATVTNPDGTSVFGKVGVQGKVKP
jgi:hypothetical protein